MTEKGEETKRASGSVDVYFDVVVAPLSHQSACHASRRPTLRVPINLSIYTDSITHDCLSDPFP